MTELNSSVKSGEVDKKLWKKLKNWFDKRFEVWYIRKPSHFRVTAEGGAVLIELQKSLKNFNDPAWQM